MASNKPLNLIEGGNLQSGVSGSQVSQLQSILKQFGYYPGPIDGVFGPQTNQAIKDFQTDNKIKVDGIFGPVTQSKLIEWQQNPLKAVANDPITINAMKSDPKLASTINKLQLEGGNRAVMVAAAAQAGQTGYNFGSGFTGTPEKMNMFYQWAKEQLDPQWNEMLQYYSNDFSSGLNKEKADYEANLAAAEQKFGSDRFALQNQQGQTNNVNSSLGARQRQSLVDSYNANLQGLNRDTAFRLSDMARKYENQLGTSDVSRFNFGMPTSNVGWWTGAQRGTSTGYTPMGNQQGQLREQYASQVEKLGKQKMGAFYNPSYN